eukprot:2885559-Prymnesium_polylepis.4
MPAAALMQATATVSSCLSCAGSIFILGLLFLRGVRNRTDVYLLVLSVFDLAQSIAFAFGQLFLPKEGEAPSGACYTQGF